MDIEVGVVTPDPLGDNDRVRACRLPAGDYATLTDREHDIRANRALLEWVRSNGIRVDRSEDPSGIALRAATRRFLPIPGRSAGRKSGPFKSICEFAKHVRLIPSHDQPLFAPSITVFLKDGRSFTRHATGREFIWDFEEEVRRIYGVVDGIPISAHQFMAPTEMPGGRKIEHSRQSPAGQRPATRLKQRSSPRKAASTTPSSVWPSWHNTIVGTANLEHLAANLAAARKGPLPPDVYAEARRRLAQPAAM